MESNRGAHDSHPFLTHCESVTISHTNIFFLVMALEPSFLGMVRMHSVAEQQRLISHITIPMFYCTSLFHIHHTLSFSFSSHVSHSSEHFLSVTSPIALSDTIPKLFSCYTRITCAIFSSFYFAVIY